MVITTRAFRTASRGDTAASAPASASEATADADRSHTVVLSPAATRLRAIAEPMIPVPSTATASPCPAAAGWPDTGTSVIVLSLFYSSALASLTPGLVSLHHTVLVICRQRGGASKVTASMLLAAAEAVAGQVDVSAPGASLVPPVDNLRASSATTTVAVAQAAIAAGVATTKPGNLVQAVQDAMWQATYP